MSGDALTPPPTLEEEEWWQNSDHIERTRREIERRRQARYYCPRCGEVAYGWNHFRNGWQVDSHSRRLGENWEYVRCPGGPIDPHKDKAP